MSKSSRKLTALVTALLFALTLFAPFAAQEAEAASKNSVDRVVTVTSSAYLGKDTIAPTLTIEADKSSFRNTEVFRVELPSSAEWRINKSDITVENVLDETVIHELKSITDQIIEIELKRTDTTGNISDKTKVEIPIIAELSNASGELKVTVNPLDSAVNGGSYAFAISTSGATIATVGKAKTITRGGSTGAATIVIDEAVVGSLKTGKQEFKLRLPSNFEWDSNKTDSDVVELVNLDGSSIKATPQGRDLVVEFTLDNVSQDRRGSIVIKTFVVPTRDAKYGDVAVNISASRGDVTSEYGLVIAKYEDYSISVEIKEVKEMLAGWEGDNDNITAEITIKELVENSLNRNRVIDFELPNWVKIAYNESVNFNIEGKSNQYSLKDSDLYDYRSSFEIDTEEFINTNGKSEVKFKLPLAIKADMEGDIVLKVSGGGVPEQEIVIATAVAPVKAEVNMVDVRLGVQGQDASEIIIKEAWAGAIADDILTLTFANDVGFRFNAGTKAEVIDGDLEIDRVSLGNDNRTINLHIKSDSTEASEIKLSNIRMTVDRTAPEGPVQLDIGGGAVINNHNIDTADTNYHPNYRGFTNRVARFDFANVITAAPGETRATSVFAIDSNTYTVIEAGKEVERTMDVAPYIKDSRTFMPVRFVADALGVSENNINWNADTKTATIFKGDRIVQMTIGNNVVTVNGAQVVMDTVPEIVDGRVMLPIIYLGQAFGAEMTWDGDARTVTVKQ